MRAGGAARWRAVAVLVAPDTACALETTTRLRDNLEPYTARIYVSGDHLVVVASVPARSGAEGLGLLEAALDQVLPPSVVVADAWSGPTPLAA